MQTLPLHLWGREVVPINPRLKRTGNEYLDFYPLCPTSLCLHGFPRILGPQMHFPPLLTLTFTMVAHLQTGVLHCRLTHDEQIISRSFRTFSPRRVLLKHSSNIIISNLVKFSMTTNSSQHLYFFNYSILILFVTSSSIISFTQ